MAALVIVLIATNLVSLAAVAVLWRRSQAEAADGSEVFAAPRPPGVNGRNRRLITIEILNPIELATARGGRVAGLAGTFAPGLTRRIVYDQTLKTLRRELEEKAVHADVRLHSLHPAAASTAPTRPATRSVPGATAVDPSTLEAVVVDEVAPLDLSKAPRD